MKAIYAPWRSEYIRGKKVEGCVFCKGSLREDEFVVHEGKTVFVMMNRYPYSCGHLLIIPFRHISQLQDLDKYEARELFSLMNVSLLGLRKILHCEDFNIGMNIGKAAGAGVDDHIHVHIVPRWSGDVNFMTSVGDTRVISENLIQTSQEIIAFFKDYISPGGLK